MKGSQMNDSQMNDSQMNDSQMNDSQMNDSQYVAGWPAAVVGLQEFFSVASEMWCWNVPSPVRGQRQCGL